MSQPLEEYPVVIQWTLPWSDVNASGEVSTAVFRFFESGRIAYFLQAGFDTPEHHNGIGPILASTEARWHHPLSFPDELMIGTRVRELQADRFLMEYAIFSEKQQCVVVEGSGQIVVFDYRKNCKAELPAAVREKIEALETAK